MKFQHLGERFGEGPLFFSLDATVPRLLGYHGKGTASQPTSWMGRSRGKGGSLVQAQTPCEATLSRSLSHTHTNTHRLHTSQGQVSIPGNSKILPSLGEIIQPLSLALALFLNQYQLFPLPLWSNSSIVSLLPNPQNEAGGGVSSLGWSLKHQEAVNQCVFWGLGMGIRGCEKSLDLIIQD